MKTCYFLLPALLSLAIATTACQPQKDKTAGADTPAAGTQNDTDVPRYWHLTGAVDKFPIVLDLAYRPAEDQYGISTWHGNYYYKNKEDLIDLYGSVDSTGMLVLNEIAGFESTGSFSGKFDPGTGAYEGIWTSGNGKKKLPFSLKEDYSDGSIQFSLTQFRDSVKLFENQPESPGAFMSMVWMAPGPDTDAASVQFLEEAIRKGMLGDSLARVVSTPQKGFELMSREFMRSYRTDMDEVTTEELEPDSYFAYSYEQNASVEVLYNQNNLLTLGYWDYWYGGGAHGNYATLLATYDLQNRKEIKLEDVFRPEYETKLGPTLAQAVRSRFSLSASEPLSAVLFDDEVAPTENFGLTGKGVIFNYPPYEIGPYAIGEVRLFVPYQDIKTLLQPDFLSRFVSK
ncbi:MAG: DUF3298 and DUF4163 domain-containing protein [Saprospiraceae bacterium]|nr:DUF3298 and DUF4163 domain-containing protein [Saprospiraceae bacterium]